LIVDSTGLKLHGAGEWLFGKHGTAKRRAWRKLHIGIDAGRGEIVAFDLTNKDVDDASHVETLLEQLDEAPASFMADGAYDRASVLDAVLAGNPGARFVVPPCKRAVTGPTAATSPTQRDRHILWVEEHGRMNWQKANDEAIIRLVGAILLEQNDEWAVQRARYMTLETKATLSDDPVVGLPAMVI
jgi:Transposase DDE domain